MKAQKKPVYICLPNEHCIRVQSYPKAEEIIHQFKLGAVFNLTTGNRCFRLLAAGHIDLGKITKPDFVKLIENYGNPKNNQQTEPKILLGCRTQFRGRETEPTKVAVAEVIILRDTEQENGARSVTLSDGKRGLRLYQKTSSDIRVVHKYYFPDSNFRIETNEDAGLALGLCLFAREQQITLESIAETGEKQQQIAAEQQRLIERFARLREGQREFEIELTKAILEVARNCSEGT